MERRRSAIRTAVVWDALQAVLAARSVDARDRPLRGRRPRGRHRRARRPDRPSSATTSSWSIPAPTRWPRSSAAPPRPAGRPAAGSGRPRRRRRPCLDVVDAGQRRPGALPRRPRGGRRARSALEAAAAALAHRRHLCPCSPPSESGGRLRPGARPGTSPRRRALLDDPDGRWRSELTSMPRRFTEAELRRAARCGRVRRRRRARSPDLRRPPQQRRGRLRARGRRGCKRSRPRWRRGPSSWRSRPSFTCSPPTA